MIPVPPQTKTTLLITRTYDRAINFITARAAFRQLLSGRVKGMDKDGNTANWEGVELDNYPSVESSYSWKDGTMSLYDDQPCLRSAPNHETGEETQWAIPTICVCNRNFGYRAKTEKSVPLKRIYNIYRGICQYCWEHIPYHQATKDHIYPKDKGGSNHDFNLVLACKRCNNMKSNIYPYFDKNGNLPVPAKYNPHSILNENAPPIREEWKQFMYML